MALELKEDHREVLSFFMSAFFTLCASLFAAGVTSFGVKHTNQQFLGYMFPGKPQDIPLGICLIP